MSSLGKGPNLISVMPASSVDETLSRPIDVLGYDRCTFYITGAGTVSSGVITYEEAPTIAFTGTWSSITTTDLSMVTVSNGAVAAVHLTSACYGAIRCRISTVVGGGGTVGVSLAVQ